MRSYGGDFKDDYNGFRTTATAINGDGDGDYTRLDAGAIDNHIPEASDNCYRNTTINSGSTWLWVKIFAICAVLSVPALVIVKHYGPMFVKKEVIPIVNWLINNFSPPVLAAIIFAAIALFPVLLLPTVPFKWIAGMTFGYGVGFLLIFAALAVAVSLPYFIGCHLFYHKIKKWLDEHPREASIVRLAGDGDWFHQFRAIVLIRLTPFPYVVFNYAAVVTGVKYCPYLGGSLVGIVPEIFVAIYSGILIRRLAEAMEDHTPVSKLQMILDGTGFCLTLAASIVIGFYAKRKLKQLQEEEQSLPPPP